MPHVKTFDRNQMMFCSWDSFVDAESEARLIDAFVNSLDMNEYAKKKKATEGRPSYDPAGLFKLFIYGNRNDVRSSRKLAAACRVNMEVKWMLGGVEPDFRTISDFRKDNIDSMKKIFHEFNRRLSGAVKWGFTSIDGSKFTANNSKNANFTATKLDDRIAWLNAHTDEYLRLLQETDETDEAEEETKLTRELVESKLAEARDRLEKYEGYRKLMEESGISQLSLTDADARLMKSKNGFVVAYNPQTAVDSETHLIRDFHMTNQPTDHGLLMETMSGIRKEEETAGEILEVVADKGYEKTEDIQGCLENGIIPHVIPDDMKDGFELELSYQEAETNPESRKPEELSRCLHAGVVPEAYKDVIESIEVLEVRRKVEEKQTKTEDVRPVYGTQEEMKARAKEGYFVRDPERNCVYCPAGEILRQKCIKKGGQIRYANKLACRHCKNRNHCYKGKNEYKEIDFSKDKLEKACPGYKLVLQEVGRAEESENSVVSERKNKVRFEKRKIVKLFFRPDRVKMAQRMCLSEHPFGTIKRAMGATYFLLKGMRKVEGEFALFCLGYNLKRAKNLLGFEKMMELMTIA